MIADWAVAFGRDFGNTASYITLIVFLSTVPFCIYKQRWPGIGPAVVLLMSSLGAISGFKVLLLTLLFPPAQLGFLADDKPTLIVGGVVFVLLSAKEATASWRRVACV